MLLVQRVIFKMTTEMPKCLKWVVNVTTLHQFYFFFLFNIIIFCIILSALLAARNLIYFPHKLNYDI